MGWNCGLNGTVSKASCHLGKVWTWLRKCCLSFKFSWSWFEPFHLRLTCACCGEGLGLPLPLGPSDVIHQHSSSLPGLWALGPQFYTGEAFRWHLFSPYLWVLVAARGEQENVFCCWRTVMEWAELSCGWRRVGRMFWSGFWTIETLDRGALGNRLAWAPVATPDCASLFWGHSQFCQENGKDWILGKLS